MKKFLCLSIFLLLSYVCMYAQQNDSMPAPPPQGNTKSPKEEVFEFVEQMAQFGNSEDDLLRYLAKEIHYPKEARKKKTEGRVIAEFIVSKTGQVYDIHIIKGIGMGCDEEVVRVLQNMPAWQAARQNGKAVNCKFKLPVLFALK